MARHGRLGGEQRGGVVGAGDLGRLFDLLHPLSKELGRTFVQDERVDHPQLDAKQEDDQAGHEILIAVEFHHDVAFLNRSIAKSLPTRREMRATGLV
jgi:hypothetical protein